MSLYQYGQKWGLVAANLMRKLWASATAPTSPVTGEIYLDISASPYLLKRYNGATWDTVGVSENISGWIPDGNIWTFSSEDAPTYILSVNADMTALIGVGMRIKLTHAAAVKYFIVTAVGAFLGGNTLITVYGGTDYTLAATAITLPFYSSQKAPFGFPLNPAKWAVELIDKNLLTQANPAAAIYNIGGLSLSIPIGVWRIEYFVNAHEVASSSDINFEVGLSTANNTMSDDDLRVFIVTFSSVNSMVPVSKVKNLSLAAKTTYYLNLYNHTSVCSAAYFYGSRGSTIIRAICAYL